MVISKEKENRDLTSGNLLKKIIIYLIPLFLSNALQILFTTVDIFTVTHFGGGNISSGAIGATNDLLKLIICVFWGITSGISVVVANAKGAKNPDKVTKAIGSSIILMFIASLIVVIIGIFFSKPLLQVLNTREEFIDKSTQYLMIYFIGSPFNLLYATGAAILRAFGDSKRPFFAIIIGGIVNVCLDLLLVISFNMDVAGVAIATIASQAVSMIIVFLYLFKDKRLSQNFKFKYIRLYKDEALDVLRMGLASGLQSLIFNITNVTIQKCVNDLGAAAVIGKSAASNIDSYEYALLNGISVTCTVAVSQNYGSRNKKRMLDSLKICNLLQIFLVTAFTGLILLCNHQLLSLFIAPNEATSDDAFYYGFLSLLILGLPYGLCGIPENFSGYLRGMKYSIVPTLVSLLCIVGFRLTYIYTLFNLPQLHNFAGLMIIYPISWLLCIIAYIPVSILLSKKKFKEMDLQQNSFQN